MSREATAERPAGREAPDIEASSERYAARFSGSVGAWFLEAQARATLTLLSQLPTGARVLDVGGGHAQLAPAVERAGYEVTVLGSALACGARLQGLIQGRRCRYEVGALTQLPHPDRSFDVVLAFRLLPHLEAWRELIGEICRVASACVVLDYPSQRSVNLLAPSFFGLKKRIEGDTRPFTLFRPEEVATELGRHGFEVVASRPQFLLPMALHRIHGRAELGRALEVSGRLLGLTRFYGSPVILRADSVPVRSRALGPTSRSSTA